MAKIGDYTINDIYQGGSSSFEPPYKDSFEGYRMLGKGIGMSTDARTANILKEISENLSAGAKSVELTQVFPEVFESIPNDQLKEVKRLSKLTGVEVSVHIPLIEPSGMTKEGFTEYGREAAERQINLAVERSHEINPDGNIPITLHSSAILPGQVKPKGEQIQETFIINAETGAINRIPLKQVYFPGEEKPTVHTGLNKINEDSWRQSLTHLAYNAERAIDYIKGSGYLATTAEAETEAGKVITPQEKQAKTIFNVGTAFLQDSYREFKSLYDMAYKNGVEEEKNILVDLGKQITDKVNIINKNPNSKESIMLRQEVVEQGLDALNKLSIPQLYRPLDEFAKEKTTETFANVAFNSFKKFKDKSPIINIENPPIGGAFSTGEELREVIEKSREKFVKKAVESGMSQSDAKRNAEKLIGATWDVGHINMLRKYGYEGEDIIKETEKIAPLVKHVHLSDNFGFEHTELPMGMGNVPMKEIMEKLEKEGYKGKKVIEALHWWQHFSPGGKQNPPLKATLEYFGSSIYNTGVSPYWNQAAGFQQGYLGGYGNMLPQTNYEMFGAGFSQLPIELGGQKQGASGSRMSGKPME